MKATGQLKDEHQGVLLMISILEKIGQKLKDGEAVDPIHLKQALEFLQVFVDKCHHDKEESLLFPEVRKTADRVENEVMDILIQEHELGREYIKLLKDSIEKYDMGDKAAGEEVTENISNYAGLIKGHIEKENEVLFKEVDEKVSESVQNELYEGFENIEVEKIGEGKHEEFHRMLDDLSKIYLQ